MADLDFIWRDRALVRAKAGDYRELASRIREGRASQEERELAAEIILAAPKPAAHRPPSFDDRDVELYFFIRDRLDAGEPMKVAVDKAKAEFSLGKSKVYEIFAKYKAADEASR